MKRSPAAFDRVEHTRASSMSHKFFTDLLEKAEAASKDSDQCARLEKHWCKACFYVLGRIGGAAVTIRPCACCGKDQTYGSTFTDTLCLDCAKEGSLCKHCGGDLDMRERRRKWPEKKVGRLKLDLEEIESQILEGGDGYQTKFTASNLAYMQDRATQLRIQIEILENR